MSLPAVSFLVFFPTCGAGTGPGWDSGHLLMKRLEKTLGSVSLVLSLLTSVFPSTVWARWKQQENVYPFFPAAKFSFDIHTNIWRWGTKSNECSSSDNGNGDANIFLRADITHRTRYPLKMEQAGNRNMFSRSLIHLWRTDASWVMKDNENVLGCL